MQLPPRKMELKTGPETTRHKRNTPTHERTTSVSSSGKLGQDLTWEFFRANFERIQGMLAKASPSLMDAVILFCCGGFTEEGKMQEVRTSSSMRSHGFLFCCEEGEGRGEGRRRVKLVALN